MANDVPFLYRIKGILSIAADDRKYIVQAVQDLFEISPSHERWTTNDIDASESRVSTAGLRQCAAVQEKDGGHL
jgi:G3E family GTPase